MSAREQLLQASRPSFEVEGTANAPLADGLLGLLIVETTEGLYRCEATFGNWGPRNGQTGFLYFDRRDLDFGFKFKVKLQDTVLFQGRITGLEARFGEGSAPELTVLAEDALQDFRMTRRTRTLEELTDADLVRRLASDHGLQAQVQLDGPTHPVLAQVNQSDLAWLRDRVRAVGGELWVEDRTLHARRRDSRNGTPIALTYGRQLREFRVLADLAGQRTSVIASGWEVSSKSAVREEAQASVLGSEVSGGESGPALLEAKFGARKESLVHGTPAQSQEARALAESYFKTLARRFLTGRGVAEPTPGLRVGASVDLTGLGPLFSGRYFVAEVRHCFDGKLGLRTEVHVERPWLGRP
ncbi:MAG: phage late control D family protein [Verrucomicrobia bacterium]|nr:phage late control D family protein [Verrucomicrobiota bacterium]